MQPKDDASLDVVPAAGHDAALAADQGVGGSYDLIDGVRVLRERTAEATAPADPVQDPQN